MGRPATGLAPFIDGWETVPEMEAALAIPEGNLQETITGYNQRAAEGADPEFHKHPDWVVALDTGPWGVRPVPRQGHLPRLHARRAVHVGER